MPANAKTTQALLVKIQKAGSAGIARAALIGKTKILEKQAGLQELEKSGSIIQESRGGMVFFFAAGSPPVPPLEAMGELVRRTDREKGPTLWKEADLIKALTKSQYYTQTEAAAAAKALCNGLEMVEVKEGKAKKYIHCRSLMPNDGDTPGDGAGYFVSEPARLIYALVELDGESRQRALGLTHAHYGDAELAKQWRKRIAMQVHPDVCRHPNAQTAVDELTVMFKEMTA